ncbi:MAG: energy transducer TonB [Roseovarius sp.]
MNTGQIISGAGHLGLIVWAIFGGAFESEPLPFEAMEVTTISSEEFAALTAPESAPEAVANVDTPEPPQAGEAPGLTSEADAAPDLAQPDPAESTPPDEVPEITEPAPPDAEVSDEPPVMQPPQEDTAVLLPEPVEPAPEARPEPAPRVAPEPVARPEPDVRIDEVDQQEARPDEEAEPVETDREETAREEATTEIVTEADRLEEAAPSVSVRPRARPAARPETEPEPETQTAETPQVDDSAVDDAVAAALGQAGAETQPESTPQGPPLTSGEKDALRLAVSNCWVVDTGAPSARVTVTLGFSLGRDGRVLGDIRLISAEGGDTTAQNVAFEAARRAIIRCGANGYRLPPEKYDQWRDIEMTFNPERMRIR